MRLLKLLLIACCCSVTSLFAADTVIDRDGNEIGGFIRSESAVGVSIGTDSLSDSGLRVIPRSQIFMIKYGDGHKTVFTEVLAGSSGTVPVVAVHSLRKDTVSRHIVVGLLADYGAFGLFNVNNDFSRSKYGKYTLGGTLYAEYRFNAMYSAGLECIMRWGKPDTQDSARPLIDPMIRSKALFPVAPNLLIGPVAGVGMSIWPEVAQKAYLDPSFTDARMGWALRGALDIQYALLPNTALDVELGYSISSTEAREVWISHDMMLISVGAAVSF